MEKACALCLEVSEIQNSHLIPSWAYRRILSIDPSGSRSPIHITGQGAHSTNKQITKHLLCKGCESRLSKNEGHLARITRPEIGSGSIYLRNHITQVFERENVGIAYLNRDEDGHHLTYFASSVIWRACVMLGACRLGPYEEEFRKYLLGESDFPKHACMSVAIIGASDIVDARGWITQPSSIKTSIGWMHGFLFVGLAFRCWVGKVVPEMLLEASLTNNERPNKRIVTLKPEQCPDFLAAAELALKAQPRGKLAERMFGDLTT